MAITASQVKELREMTGAGMLDCKNALTETNGDITKAVDWLREKGIAKSAKKAGRIAAEGLSKIVVDGNKAVVIEVNSETDFVAKNEQFLALLDTAAKTILAGEPKDLEAALALACNGHTLNDEFVNATATIGEKIVLRRFEIVKKAEDEVFGTYSHMGGTISSIAVVKGSAEVAKDTAMQVASMNPQYIDQDHMPVDVVEHEKSIQKELMAADPKLAGKPEKVLEGILKGKLSKALQDICLLDQEYFKDTDKKFAQFLKESGASVTYFVRYQVGEGIEKRQENFAEEVAKQMNA